MADYYFKEFEDYVKLLCVQHVDLLHNDTTKRVFIRFQSDEDIQSIPNNAGSIIVVMANFFGRSSGDDGHKLHQTASIQFLQNVAATDGDVYAQIQSALDKTLDILFDFFARMKQDYFADSCGPLRYLTPEAMTYLPVEGPVLENHFGWEMNIPFNANAPAYNAAKWNV